MPDILDYGRGYCADCKRSTRCYLVKCPSRRHVLWCCDECGLVHHVCSCVKREGRKPAPAAAEE